MPNWDEDSPQLRHNLTAILQEIVRAAEQRETPTVEAARRRFTRMNGDERVLRRKPDHLLGETGIGDGRSRGVLARPLEQVEQEHQQQRDDDPKREVSQIIQRPSFFGRQI